MSEASQKAYTTLLQRIQRGELLPGAFLIESEVALQLGLSRTPVREAIRRLAAEGLVRSGDRRRAVVREFEEAQIEELYELRSRLESYAAERAATRIDAAGLARLTTLAGEMEACAARGDAAAVARFAELNDAFHQQILLAAAAPHLEAALRPMLQIQLVMLQRYRPRIAEHLERSCWHHRELLRALSLRDATLASEQMRLHMLAARASSSTSAAGNSRD